MAISRDAVIWGFRLVLGREPESEEGIRAHTHLASETELVEVLLRSDEFRASGRFAEHLQVRASEDRRRGPPWRHDARANLTAVVYGNCQVRGVARLLQAMTGDLIAEAVETTPTMLRRLQDGDSDIEAMLRRADLVFVQHVGEIWETVRQRFPRYLSKLRSFPPIAYAGFHPDCVYVRHGSRHLGGPMGEYHSSIALWAHRQGLKVSQAVDLFRPDTYEALGFPEYHDAGYRTLVQTGQSTGIGLSDMIGQWHARGCWMHTINHPRLEVLADVVAAMLRREGIAPIEPAGAWVHDPLLRWAVWPVYPGLDPSGRLHTGFAFKSDDGANPARKPVLALDLPGFVEASYRCYDRLSSDELDCPRLLTPAYEGLHRLVRSGPSLLQTVGQALARTLSGRPVSPATPHSQPYADLPDTQFWRRVVSPVDASALDPVVAPKFSIAGTDQVATAGSCFAQHIARTLQREGLNYYVAESLEGLDPEERTARQFGLFSARYGNIYTARQLVQLFDRAFGEFEPVDEVWQRPDGRYVDPFRPQIEPGGHAMADDVQLARAVHLADVRRMFEQLDVFVFTLGLTEGWRRRTDGAVFPLAPGVVAGTCDPALYEFVNFRVDEVVADLQAFVRRLLAVRPGARVLFTVSPVPLIATREPEHVLTATTYSKAVLRAAAGELKRWHPAVDYFPSFEIITSHATRGAYFEPDLRSISSAGVDHVMRVFMRHYGHSEGAGAGMAHVSRSRADLIAAEQKQLQDVICDEEALDRPDA